MPGIDKGIPMKGKTTLAFTALMAIFYTAGVSAAQTYNTTLQFEHDWKSKDARHTESIKLINKLPHDIDLELKMSPSDGGGQKPNVAYDDMVGGTGAIVLQQDYWLNKADRLAPNIEAGAGSSSTYVEPGLKWSHVFNETWDAYVRYRFQLTKYSRSNRYSTVSSSDKYGYADEKYLSKADVGKHLVDFGFDYRISPKFSFSYVFDWYYGDYLGDAYKYSKGTFTKSQYALYDGRKTDYQNEFEIQYAYSSTFRPYFEIAEVSYSSTSNQRQAKFELGFKYKL